MVNIQLTQHSKATTQVCKRARLGITVRYRAEKIIVYIIAEWLHTFKDFNAMIKIIFFFWGPQALGFGPKLHTAKCQIK